MNNEDLNNQDSQKSQEIRKENRNNGSLKSPESQESQDNQTKQEKEIEIANAKEEISEIVSQCNYCGLCNESDSVWKVLREESLSSRARAILFSNSVFDKSVFDSLLSGHCQNACPFRIDIDAAIRLARKIVNLKGQEPPANKALLRKILNRQNPFED